MQDGLALLWQNFHFLRPWWLLALLPVLLFTALLLNLRKEGSLWKRAIDPALLPFLLDNRGGVRHKAPVFGLCLMWVLATLALAGPVWKQLPVPVQEREDAMVIMLDLSMSMYATDLTPNRLTRARRKLADILSQRQEEGQTALLVYAGDAHVVTPLTTDVATIRSMIPALQPDIIPLQGSDPESAIVMALELLGNAGMDQASLLLMTDGIEDDDIRRISRHLGGSRHRLAILGIGTEDGAPIPTSQGGFLRDSQNAIVIPRLPRQRLQQLASETGGRYTDIRLDDQDLAYLMSPGLFRDADSLADSDREFDTWYETGPWLVLLLLPFAALSFRRGWLLSLVLCVGLLPTEPAYAQSRWQSLWKNPDQRGRSAFEEQRFDEAAEAFNDPRWRAASDYRRGNFEAVIDALDGREDPESHYNRGNALARMMRLQEAIDAYDQALALQPDFPDAQHNRDLVQQMLDEQEPEQQGSDEDGEPEEQDGEESPQDQGDQSPDQSEQQEPSEEDSEGDSEDQEQDSESSEQDADTPEDAESDMDGEQDASQDRQEQHLEDVQPDSEEEQSMQQWLGRIQDDPAELLRNKFRQQAQQRLFEEMRNNPDRRGTPAPPPAW